MRDDFGEGVFGNNGYVYAATVVTGNVSYIFVVLAQAAGLHKVVQSLFGSAFLQSNYVGVSASNIFGQSV